MAGLKRGVPVEESRSKLLLAHIVIVKELLNALFHETFPETLLSLARKNSNGTSPEKLGEVPTAEHC